MTKNDLGLPLEYQVMPQYFDAHNCDQTTQQKNALIAKLLRVYGVEDVLDMTCGTGSQLFYLRQKGFRVAGSDLSVALLEIARQKALDQKVEMQLVEGDMRDIMVGEFDAVITIFNAIGHVSKADFGKTLRNIAKNLKANGIYIFDIFNAEAMDDDLVKDLAMDAVKMINGDRIHHRQISIMEHEQGRLISHDYYHIRHASGEVKECQNSFSLQLYSAAELREILQHHGFETLQQITMEGEEFVANKSVNILTVARKKG